MVQSREGNVSAYVCACRCVRAESDVFRSVSWGVTAVGSIEKLFLKTLQIRSGNSSIDFCLVFIIAVKYFKINKYKY